MPFRYRLQKILEIRIRKKEEQLRQVLEAQKEVERIELLIIKNREEIKNLNEQMHQADPMMYEQYDKFIKHLWVEDEKLQQQKSEALKQLEKEKELLKQREKEVNVLEKHKENKKEAYLKEETAKELKQLSEVGTQKFFARNKESKEESEKRRNNTDAL